MKLINEVYSKAESLLTAVYSENNDKKLIKNTAAIELIKNLLDSVKDLERTVKPLLGTGKEDKDELFYGEFLPVFNMLTAVDRLYDKVRNYMTQKPYSTDKIKLNFDNQQLLGGWVFNKENDYSSFILRDNNYYFLAIMDSKYRSTFKNIPFSENDEDGIEKMFYHQIADPAKDVQNLMVINGKTVKKNGKRNENGENLLLEEYKSNYLPPEINKIRKEKSYLKTSENFKKDDLIKFIDYYKKRTIEYYDSFTFNFKDSDAYNDFSEFTSHINSQAYQVYFKKISRSFIDDCVNNGQLYLFQIYNKDFSEHSHGTPNMHTLYFKMLFDERNLADVVFKLNGESEMFYREASIKDSEKTVHPANEALKNKNPDNAKAESTFTYDLIKDKRFTKRQFSIHIPITINFKANGRDFLNYKVRLAIKNSPSGYVIGIDRGERNLIYISVINAKGEIAEQMSLNEIISDKGYKVNYQSLLDRKEKERDEAKKSWGTVENIKELKEGYLSQVVHKIAELVVKYDAVIAMEDLNSGFKNSRIKVEKQVYQKFENMLISKLNYLVDKKAEHTQIGGVLNGYQLTNKYDGTNKFRQNGIIFYIPAWLTSKIDPTTGFADLLKPKYTTVEAAREFFGKFEAITYNSADDMFEFAFDYSMFPNCRSDYKKKWTVCTNGSRIETFHNPKKNNEWDNKSVCLTDEFKKLFDEYKVDYSSNIKAAILGINDKEFQKRLMNLLRLTLQMRNSITGSTNPEDDYLISPVRNAEGRFFDSRDYQFDNSPLPTDADANGAYNIARKAQWAINVLKNTPDEEIEKANLSITNAKWLEFAQK